MENRSIKTTDTQIRIAEVIITSLTMRGDGTTTPIRRVTQVFTKEGNLIAECDPLPEERKPLLGRADVEALTNYFYQHLNAFQEDPQRLLSEWLKEIAPDLQ